MAVFLGALVVVLFLAAGAITASRWRKGTRPAIAVVMGVPLLAGGAWVWFGLFVGEEPVERTWPSVISVLLGIIAMVAAIDARRAAQILLATVVAFPFVNAAYVAWMHANVPANRLDDLGDVIAFGLVDPTLYCPAALLTWVILRFGGQTPPHHGEAF